MARDDAALLANTPETDRDPYEVYDAYQQGFITHAEYTPFQVRWQDTTGYREQLCSTVGIDPGTRTDDDLALAYHGFMVLHFGKPSGSRTLRGVKGKKHPLTPLPLIGRSGRRRERRPTGGDAMTAEQAMELDRQQHDHANASVNASARTEDAHYDAAYEFYLDHGFWPVNDEELAGYKAKHPPPAGDTLDPETPLRVLYVPPREESPAMQTEYTPEDVRTLLDEHETLEYASATDADVADAADVLEGVEELVTKLDPAVRRDELLLSSLPAGEHSYVPVVRNCSLGAGVAIDPEGATSFMVTNHVFAGDSPTYFSARQAVRHALLRRTDAGATSSVEPSPEEPPEGRPSAEGDAILAALGAYGNALAAGRTVADVDPKVLAALYPLSEAGVAHLFASEAGGGIVLATAGSTASDRRRAVERLAALPDSRYSSHTTSVLFECGAAGSHYSEEYWFGHALKQAPKPKERELDEAAERFRAARFVRPSEGRPLDTAAIRRRVRDQLLVRASVRAAFDTDSEDGVAVYRAVALAVVIARISSRAMVRRALAAERPWDTEAERGRMQKEGTRLRREIVGSRRARGGRPVEVTPAENLDAASRERLADEAASLTSDPKLRASIERRRKSGRAAYDTARAVYLQRCPELGHKLLHLLRRDGVRTETEIISRHVRLAEGSADPEGAILAALRSLAEAGKVRRVRSRKTGEVFVAATEPLDETGYRRALNGLISEASCGIVSPWSDTAAVRADGEADEWRWGTEDLEGGELERLAPRRLIDTASYERPLPAVDLLAEPAAEEEIEAVAKGVA